MSKWWQNPLLGTDDDEGAYDYYAEELPSDGSEWSWCYSKCDECGKHRKLHRTDTHYFYCWDGWDSMSQTTCWKCHVKNVVKFNMRKIKEFMRQNILKIDIGAYVMYKQFCKKHSLAKDVRKDMWIQYYDLWHDKSVRKILSRKLTKEV